MIKTMIKIILFVIFISVLVGTFLAVRLLGTEFQTAMEHIPNLPI